MKIELKIPFLSYGEIREISFDLLKTWNLDQIVPVDIEEIIEIRLRKNISPRPGLRDAFDIEGWTSNDLSTINVDEFIFLERERRCRYTLAHELGHIVLHRDVFKKLRIETIEDWKRFYLSVDEKSYSLLETQAYNFAGLILVPSVHLEKQFTKLLEQFNPQFESAKKQKLAKDIYSDYFLDVAFIRLSEIFGVSRDVIERRLQKDDLVSRIP